MERYDLAIVGSGPAGLSAALNAKIRNKKFIIFGTKDLSNKIMKAPKINNYLGFYGMNGAEVKEKFAEHIDKMGIQITEERVNNIYAMGDYFTLMVNDKMYEATAVILATGMEYTKPLKGELELLGKGVGYCATCDGMLYKGKNVVVIGYTKEDEKEADYLAEIVNKVIYLPMYQGETDHDARIEVVRDQNPTGIEKQGNRCILQTDSGKIEADGIFILRESVAPSQLVPGLAIEKNHVIVDREQRTNIAGLFACGDITGAPYQYIKAAGEGNVAALSAVNYLSDKTKQQ